MLNSSPIWSWHWCVWNILWEKDKKLETLFTPFYAPRIDRSVAYNFCSVHLSIFLFVCLFVHKNFHFGYSFWMVGDTVFVFPLGKTLSVVPKLRSSLKIKVKYQGHHFQKNGNCRGIHVSQTHLVPLCFLHFQKQRNIWIQIREGWKLASKIFMINLYHAKFALSILNTHWNR